MRKLPIVILSLLVSSFCSAQQREVDIKFRLAQSYERMSNYDAAIKLYEEIYRSDSTNFVVFDALRRAYLQIKKYDEAITLTRRRLAQTPNDVGLWAQLGTMYIRASDEKSANDAWGKAIAVDPKNEFTYRLVAGAMIEARLFEPAIATYRRGRDALQKPLAFNNDLAYLYGIMLNYGEATREYLSMLHDTPGQLTYVQSRIGTYTVRADGLSAATLVVEQASSSEPNTLPYRQLLAWLYMEGKRFDDAYTVYHRIDEMSHAEGKEIFNFADRALREHAYTIASKAFADLITNYPKFPQLPQAKFGYARTLEEANSPQDSLNLSKDWNLLPDSSGRVAESDPPLKGALEAYTRVVNEYPGSEVAALSLLRIAGLQFDRFLNIDEAMSALLQLDQKYARYPAITLEAKLRLGEIYVAQGKLDKAEESYTLALSAGAMNKDVRERAAFRLAELRYFQGRFADAVRQLQDLTKDASANVTNDALGLLIFIKENTAQGDTDLKEYADADLLARQRRLSEALARYETILQAKKNPDLLDETLMSVGDIYARMRRFPEALSSYEHLARDYPESINLDRAQMKIGLIYETGMHEKEKAIAAYGALLEKYPNSIYASEARKKIRELRGDTL